MNGKKSKLVRKISHKWNSKEKKLYNSLPHSYKGILGNLYKNLHESDERPGMTPREPKINETHPSGNRKQRFAIMAKNKSLPKDQRIIITPWTSASNLHPNLSMKVQKNVEKDSEVPQENAEWEEIN